LRKCVLLSRREADSRLHLFGYASDLERADILFISLLVQMARALAQQPVPAAGGRAEAWRRSWMLGYATAVVTRVRAAEETAAATADNDAPGRLDIDRARLRRPRPHRPPPRRPGLPPQDPRHLHITVGCWGYHSRCVKELCRVIIYWSACSRRS
jgi:hypothetical protein